MTYDYFRLKHTRRGEGKNDAPLCNLCYKVHEFLRKQACSYCIFFRLNCFTAINNFLFSSLCYFYVHVFAYIFAPIL
jgi:hypothetical protein